MDEAATPDLGAGVPIEQVPAGGVLGVTLDGKPWLLARVDGQIVALGGKCTHLGAPLVKSLRSGDTVRCPWHHACFDLRTGRALEAPAFAALPQRAVRVQEGRVFAAEEGGRREDGVAPSSSISPQAAAKRIVVVGAGAAGFAAVERLWARGHTGELVWLDADPAAPLDRTKLSKAYLAGKADADALLLAEPSLKSVKPRRASVVAIDPQARTVELEGGDRVAYDALLLAPGAAPKRMHLPGFDRDDVRLLRTQADADAILAHVKGAARAAVVGAGFIGLEVAGSLRSRGLHVEVVTPEALPLAGKLGPELGGFVKDLHEAQGVIFHLGGEAAGWDGKTLTLKDGAQIAADVLVVGVGVEPRLELAQGAGLAVEGAIPVDATMKVEGVEGVWAAGDAARFPGGSAGEAIRVEHWVAAERMGQIAADAMLGLNSAWAEPPFFWSAHYGVSIRYVGHAESWDTIEVHGALADKDAELRYVKDGKVLAVATVGRDMAALKAAEAFRRKAAAA